jgi:TRAP-type C4-dicarboxylate transport system substrate-binding protein
MKNVRGSIEKNGVMVLSDAWFGGGMASKRGCIVTPSDVKGLKFRAAGPTFAQMWQSAGASIVSVPSNEIYNAFQTGVAEATDTSMGSFLSFRLYEQAKCLTVPGTNALWMMYEPLLMSKKTFARLSKAQQDVLVAAGRKAQKYYEDKAEAVDAATIKAYKDHGVEIRSLTDAEYGQWVEVARKSSYAEFSKDVPDGKKLIDEALSVK